MNNTCDWTKDPSFKSLNAWYPRAKRWEATCGRRYVMPTDGVGEDGFHYCPFCGKSIRTFQNVEERDNAQRNERVYNEWLCSGCRMEVQYQCKHTGDWFTTRFPIHHFLDKANLRLVPEEKANE